MIDHDIMIIPTNDEFFEMKHQSLTSINENGFLNMRSGGLSTCYGFCDWFCSDQSFINSSKQLLTKANKVVKMLNMNADEITVSFKNCCPLNGPTYDIIYFIDARTDQYLFTVVPKSTHSGLCEVYIDSPQFVNEKLLTICNAHRDSYEHESHFETFAAFIKLLK